MKYSFEEAQESINSIWRTIVLFFIQDLANILHSSQLVDDDTIKTQLELENFVFSEIPFEQPGTEPKLEQRELGRLAKEVDKSTMDSIIVGQLRIPAAQVSSVHSDNRAHNWSAVFEILVRWSYNTENTREVRYIISIFFLQQDQQLFYK